MSRDRPIFPSPGPLEEMRAILRTHGYADDAIGAMSQQELRQELAQVRMSVKAERAHERQLARYMKAGLISRAQLDRMTAEERVDLVKSHKSVESYRWVTEDEDADDLAEKHVPMQVREALSREELLSLFTEVVGVVAALKAENDELRRNLSNVHHLQLAVLDRKDLFDRLLSADRDFEGIEADLEIEEVSSTSTETTQSASVEATAEAGDTRDTTAAIQGLASQVIGLSGGRRVDVSTLNRRVERMKESARTSAKVRSKGRVSFKIAKVTRHGKE